MRLESSIESVPVAILTQGFYKYAFLKASVCEVVPLLTTVRADYSNEEISSDVTSSTPFQPENAELLSFIASVARFQSINSQGLTSSTIGDTLYSIYSSTTTGSINNNLNDTLVYLELVSFMSYNFDSPLTIFLGGLLAWCCRIFRHGEVVVGPFNTVQIDIVSFHSSFAPGLWLQVASPTMSSRTTSLPKSMGPCSYRR
jgi:hypothetical protein